MPLTLCRWWLNDRFHSATRRVDWPHSPSERHRLPGCMRRLNLLFAHEPMVIVFAREAQDVVNAITWARQNKVMLRVRSGGHCLEGWSSVDNGS
jgi:FAD/FMN-containing dehydrogenase